MVENVLLHNIPNRDGNNITYKPLLLLTTVINKIFQDSHWHCIKINIVLCSIV